MNRIEKYKKLDLDKITDDRLLERIERECSSLEEPQLWMKAHARREELAKEAREQWESAQQQDSMRAYWNYFRRWPRGVYASEARDRFRRRLFWNPPKDRPKPGFIQGIVRSIVSFVVMVVVLGVITLAIFGAMYFVFGGELRLAGLAAIAILYLLVRYGQKGPFGETVFGVIFCIISALLLLGALKLVAG
jgi:hypothetical protein